MLTDIARFEHTTMKKGRDALSAPTMVVSLTILHHADPRRVGARATVAESRAGVPLSRLEPLFVNGPDGRPLDDPFLSRKPVLLRLRDDVLTVDNGAGVDVRIDGEPCGDSRRLEARALADGVVLTLGARAVLLLRREEPERARGPSLGMLGDSDALERVRRQLLALAHGGANGVLLRAESGSGKELCARALHEHGPRSGRPFVAVNLAAVPASTAAAALFGHARGAFTGADSARGGYFDAAEGGTLFLDEIGDASLEVQAALLRALDQREIQPVGGRARTVDVAILAATDADLEGAVERGTFRGALLHRLQAAEVTVPPLRARREDIGTLFGAFLKDAMARAGRVLEDHSLKETAWPPASLVERLVLHPWPGNVRQLRNVAQRLALQPDTNVEALLSVPAPDPSPRPTPEPLPAAAVSTAPPSGQPVDDDALLRALRAHRFQLNLTARALGMTRVALDKRIATHPGVRKAKDLSRDEILRCHAELAGDVEAMASRLEVSVRGLKLRLTQLGLAR